MAFSYLAKGDVSGYNVSSPTLPPPPPPPGGLDWDTVPGIYSKIESYQQTNTTFFPTVYNPTLASHSNTVYGQLDRWTWYRGIQYPIAWGRIENTNTPGVYDFTELDAVIETVRDLNTISGRASALNKKVMFLVEWKTFSVAAITDMLPPYLRTVGTPYPSGKPRYHYAVGYKAGYEVPRDAYHMKLQNCRPGLTGNDAAGNPITYLRDRYKAFLTALYNKYKDNPAFIGLMNTESAPTEQFKMDDPNEWLGRQYFDGRKQFLKDIKTVITGHIFADSCSFDRIYSQEMTGNVNIPYTNSGLYTSRVAYTNPDVYLGTNLTAPYNAMDYLDGKVPIINSLQPNQMDSVNGFYKNVNAPNNEVYLFNSVPPAYGQPRVSGPNGNVSSTGNVIRWDPADFRWAIYRGIYLRSNMYHYQHNYANTGTKGGPRYNWQDFANDMNNNTTVTSPNTGQIVQNDPCGGMVKTKPLRPW